MERMRLGQMRHVKNSLLHLFTRRKPRGNQVNWLYEHLDGKFFVSQENSRVGLPFWRRRIPAKNPKTKGGSPEQIGLIQAELTQFETAQPKHDIQWNKNNYDRNRELGTQKHRQYRETKHLLEISKTAIFFSRSNHFQDCGTAEVCCVLDVRIETKQPLAVRFVLAVPTIFYHQVCVSLKRRLIITMLFGPRGSLSAHPYDFAGILSLILFWALCTCFQSLTN